MKNIDNIDKTSTKYKQYLIKKGALVKIIIFLAMLVLGTFVSLMIPLRPSESVTEKRKLSSFPQFSIESFLNGAYFSGVDTWFSDTFPGRDGFIACNERMTGLYGIRKNLIHGEVIKGDEIPDADIDENEFDYIDNIVSERMTESQDSDKEINYSYDNSVIVNPDEIGNDVEPDTTGTNASAKTGESLGSVYVLGDSAYDYYSFSNSISDEYVAIVNNMAQVLKGKATVYDMIIPTAIDITLDDATRNSINSSNQRKAILYMYSKMNRNVGKCYIYELMRSHRDEYIYFRTDHHWTALGAYYAYSAFMAQLGKNAYSLDSFKEHDMGTFVGSYYTQTRVTSLSNHPDTLYAYEPFSTNALKMINNENDFVDYNIITDVSKWNKTSKYSTFIGGDNAYTEINNPDVTDGSSVLVIKESFGNAMIPFLVENFENVYVVDYRYFNGTITELVDNKGIENVVFVNNIAITSTRDRIDELKTISK